MESMLSTSFCAVPAFMRVEPATTSGPVSGVIGISTARASSESGVQLMPAVTALVGSFFVDDVALEVERCHYPDEPAGTPLAPWRAVLQGGKTALLAIAVYLIAVPTLLFGGIGAVIFFIATAYLLGREYYELAAMRYRSPAQAKALRKANQDTVFIAGMFIAAFVSVPIASLATPLFAMALMVHVHKRTARAVKQIDGG